jgi:hypothetical protein
VTHTVSDLGLLGLTIPVIPIYYAVSKCTVELHQSPVRGRKANDRAREEQYPIIAVLTGTWGCNS